MNYITTVMVKLVCIFIGILLLTSCDNKSSENFLDTQEGQKMKNYLYQIEKDFPGLKRPPFHNIDSDSLRTLHSITSEGHLILDNDQEVILAGLDCHKEDLYKFMSSMLHSMTDRNKLAVKYTGLKSGDVKYAYVWDINFYKKNNNSSNTSHNINEYVISNGVCSALTQENHKYHERYLKLQKYNELYRRLRVQAQ